jgi:hypothetical protein
MSLDGVNYENLYIVQQSNTEECKQIKINDHKYSSKKYFTYETIYGVEIHKYYGIKTNESHLIMRNADIIWFDSIWIEQNDMSKLTNIEIQIGGKTIWKFPIQFLLKISEPESHNSKVKISFPKKIFFNSGFNFLGNPLGLNDLCGIPLVCLDYHEVRIILHSTIDIKYDLFKRYVTLESSLQLRLQVYCYNISINFIQESVNKLISKNYSNKISLDEICKIINSDHKIFDYIKKYNVQAKDLIIKSSQLLNELNNIVCEYGIENNITNIVVEDQINDYIIILGNMNILNGQCKCSIAN